VRTGFLITARLKSTRLPEKLLRKVEGRPIFAHMLDRLKLAKRVDRIVICTSTNSQDDRLVDLAVAEGVDYFRGDEDDVVDRLTKAATCFDLDFALSITADCPFSDPGYADLIVAAYEKTNADLIRALGLPHGAYSYGVKIDAFRRVLEIKDEKNSEVWSRYFTDTDIFQVYDLPIDNPVHRQPNLRMTLDYPEDLEFFRKIFACLYVPGKVFGLDEILQLLRHDPEIVEINRRCAVAYKKRWTRQSSIKLKPRYAVERAAIIGCGSIGQRHLRNLRQLGITDIVALRSKEGATQEIDPTLGVIEVNSWTDLINRKPDIAIISNPTSLHLDALRRLIPHVRGVFIEKPLAASLDGVCEILNLISTHKVVSFVGYNLQFHPAVRAIGELLNDENPGNPLVFQGQVGQWIEDWHPGEDYRRAYFSRKDLGGGAALSLIHEIHLALQLFGPAEAVSCLLPKSDLLSLEVDVIADLMINHSIGAVSQIHLDLIQRPAHRCGVISFERGSISYDLIAPRVTAHFPDQKSPAVVWQQADYDPNLSYVAEMELFLACVREGRIRHEHDAWRAAQSLAIVGAAFVSADSGCREEIPLWVRNLP
jgi:spore coat polysaccharide biosynthesis protein SpsF